MLYIPFDAYSRSDRGAATKVRVSWSGEISSAEESIKECESLDRRTSRTFDHALRRKATK